MSYCWDVYQKSECTQCSFYKAFQSGNYNLDAIKDIILVSPEEEAVAAKATNTEPTNVAAIPPAVQSTPETAATI
jgi:hypothetical protein